jgi:DNA-3-methyladenine glycosylase
LEAARGLLGARLVRDDAAGRRVGRIVEVEAYTGVEDLASHARMGPTARNRPMFGPAGIAYVYLVYGMYHCLNVVTEEVRVAAAILIRAVEPLEGIDAMRAARLSTRSRRGTPAPRDIPTHRLAAGPGLVAAAFDITRGDTGTDLCDPASPLRLIRGDAPAAVLAGPRVGIGYAPEPWQSHPWRLLVAGSPSLSRPTPHPSSTAGTPATPRP